MDWRAATFEIATTDGVRTRTGFVSGPWGLHDELGCEWVATHLPSGMIVARAPTKAKARKILSVMREAVPDAEWATLRNNSPAKVRADIGRRVMAALGARKLERGTYGGPKVRKSYRVNGYA